MVEGRIIIDPMVMEGLIKTGDGHGAFLRDLSPRELEVLSWMAKGYRNDTIADVLSRDVKTVERHINNIYSKLFSDKKDDEEDLRLWLSDPRTSAAQPMTDGSIPEPGGWNRFVVQVDDLPSLVEKLKAEGTIFRNEILSGVGGLQILAEDPSGNPIELNQPPA